MLIFSPVLAPPDDQSVAAARPWPSPSPPACEQRPAEPVEVGGRGSADSQGQARRALCVGSSRERDCGRDSKTGVLGS